MMTVTWYSNNNNGAKLRRVDLQDIMSSGIHVELVSFPLEILIPLLASLQTADEDSPVCDISQERHLETILLTYFSVHACS